MKKRFYWLVAMSLLTILLECLPAGAVLIFVNSEGEPLRRTYSYFDLTPYGYANFGPLLTAAVTVVLVVLAAILAMRPQRALCSWVLGTSGVAFLLSLAPLFYGWNYFTPVACCISAVLLLVTVCAATVRFGKGGYGR